MKKIKHPVKLLLELPYNGLKKRFVTPIEVLIEDKKIKKFTAQTKVIELIKRYV